MNNLLTKTIFAEQLKHINLINIRNTPIVLQTHIEYVKMV